MQVTTYQQLCFRTKLNWEVTDVLENVSFYRQLTICIEGEIILLQPYPDTDSSKLTFNLPVPDDSVE